MQKAKRAKCENALQSAAKNTDKEASILDRPTMSVLVAMDEKMYVSFIDFLFSNFK